MKSSPSKSNYAEIQFKKVKNRFESDDVHKIDINSDRITTDGEVPDLTVDDFKENLGSINFYTVGPSDGNGYDKTYDLTGEEIEFLLDIL